MYDITCFSNFSSFMTFDPTFFGFYPKFQLGIRQFRKWHIIIDLKPLYPKLYPKMPYKPLSRALFSISVLTIRQIRESAETELNLKLYQKPEFNWRGHLKMKGLFMNVCFRRDLLYIAGPGFRYL